MYSHCAVSMLAIRLSIQPIPSCRPLVAASQLPEACQAVVVVVIVVHGAQKIIISLLCSVKPISACTKHCACVRLGYSETHVQDLSWGRVPHYNKD